MTGQGGATEPPDFANMDVSDCDLWYKASPEIRQETGCSLFDDASLATIRAQMHLKFKKTFLHEPDANFGAVWINDRSIFYTILVGRIESIKDARLRNGEIRLRMMQAFEHQMIKKLDELPRPYPKLTVQAGTFEEPESFKSNVNLGRKFARPPGAGAI